MIKTGTLIAIDRNKYNLTCMQGLATVLENAQVPIKLFSLEMGRH